MISPSTAFWYFAFLLALGILFPCLVHLLLVRGLGLYREKSLRQKGAIMSVLGGLLPMGLAFIFWVVAGRQFQNLAWTAIFFFSIYLFFGYIYFHIFNLSETARRIRILTEGHQTGKVLRDEISQNYSYDQMVKIRLDRLVALRELKFSGGRYSVRRGILLTPARMIFAFRKILFPGRGA